MMCTDVSLHAITTGKKEEMTNEEEKDWGRERAPTKRRLARHCYYIHRFGDISMIQDHTVHCYPIRYKAA